MLAFDAGYADQAHMTRHFRRYSGQRAPASSSVTACASRHLCAVRARMSRSFKTTTRRDEHLAGT